MSPEQFAEADIRNMPLHEISVKLGTSGLIERYNIEIAELPEETQWQVNQAFLSAAEWHKDQQRTNGPYLDHILRVSLRVLCHYGIKDPDILAAALLHDSIEDQCYKIVGHDKATPEEALAEISKRFNPRVSRLLKALTNPPGHISRDEYDAHVRQNLLDEPDAVPIKISDFTDNAVGIFWTVGEEKKIKLAGKYLPLVDFYRDLITSGHYQFNDIAKAKILKQLNDGEMRMRDILKVAQQRKAGDIGGAQL